MSEIRQFDVFAHDASLVRSVVVNGGFSTKKGPDGADYTGISLQPVPHWFERIAELIGKPIIPKLSCFRLNLEGELPHSWVHSDDICAKYASVLYLNLPDECRGGTAFWKHADMGIDRLAKREDMNPGVDYGSYCRMIEGEWKKKDAWKQVAFVEMKWNRFITYPTCLFHSRFPFEGFGSGPKDGRLIWICFYDKAVQ